ncbi:AraD1 family protein [Marinivivus vitaminiproducens]|uniref:AraD1 family protein n=1 Tax=Marinivivus vitaminiproducens TaxID=3035935 RepID=UPI002797D964|nr:GguC family protein [Geminicoccaceae bacterium SCSIO 64248]
MRLVQFVGRDGQRGVGVATDGSSELIVVQGAVAIRDLALEAHAAGTGLAALVEARLGDAREDYDAALAEGRVLAPIDHPDAAHCIVSLTGLTHLGSAQSRDQMHAISSNIEEGATDTMKMFQMGLEGGRPETGAVGVQPEWAYKGDGDIIVRPGADFELPGYAEDGGEEAEVAGVYVVAPAGTPLRIGFALGNEYSDHVMEKRNYLYLAHSKLRQCSLGPELLIGDLPLDFTGAIRVRRGDQVVWEGEMRSGDDRMCHSIANLEHHHFKYAQFRRPGDVHIHYFGASGLSCAAGVAPQPGDVFEIDCAVFGRPLVNGLAKGEPEVRVDVTPL